MTAVRHHGVVEVHFQLTLAFFCSPHPCTDLVPKFYADPRREELNNGYGFIIPDGPQAYGAPRKYYFHMDSITTPDEYGGLWPGDHVSFIVVPAKKGVQAIEVTLEDPSTPEGLKSEDEIEGVVAIGKENKPPITEADAVNAGAWSLSSWGA